MLFGCRFDLVFSVGEDCSAAMHLRQAGLRDCSSPFDWICHASFLTPFDLLATGLRGFLEKENLRWFPKPASGMRDAKTENYEDRRTGYYFYHDFPVGQSLDESYPQVKEKYDRRIRRLDGRLRQGGNVLLVWWSRDKKIQDDEARAALEKVQAAYPASRFHLLMFENDLTVKVGQIREEAVSDRIIRIVGNICPNLGETTGYRPTTQKVLRKLGVSYVRQRSASPLRVLLDRALSVFHT